MKTLAWMQRTFRQNNDEQSINVSTRKSFSCFSSLRELDGQQCCTEVNNNSTHCRKPRVCPESSISLHGVKELNEEETLEISPEFFHGLLAIGTLGFVSTISNEAITPKDTMPDEIATAKEISAAENVSQCLNKKSKKLIEKEKHEVTKENKIIVEYSLNDHVELPATNEEAKEQKTMSDNHFKKDATWPMSHKRSRKLNGIKGGTHVLPFMKKMLKKLDLTSCCSPSSAGGNATICDSTENISSKVFRKSRKIHPVAADLQVPKSHNYEVKKVCYAEDYDREVTLEEEDKETVSSNMFANRPINSQPDGKKAHWIKSDADYFVLEF